MEKTTIPGIIVFQNREDLLSFAPDDAVAGALRAILHYNRTGEPPSFEKGTAIAMVYNCFLTDYNSNKEHYLQEHEKKVKAGSKGGKASAEKRKSTNNIFLDLVAEIEEQEQNQAPF